MEERYSRRNRENRSAWVGGAVLVAVGALLMLQNFGITTFTNWWALFILIPAAGAFGNAWNTYRANDGHLTAGARGSLIGGVIMTLVAAAFLFNLNWSLIWPLFLILAGVAALLNTAAR